jgi:RimJ/RimL family protein N-acetyltransferase
MELHTERLILREFVPADWTAVLAYQRDPRHLRYYEWTDRTPEDVRFVQMFLNQQAEQPRRKFQLAMTLKTSGQLVGNCGIRQASSGAHEADIGYELSSDHWGIRLCVGSVRARRAVRIYGVACPSHLGRVHRR